MAVVAVARVVGVWLVSCVIWLLGLVVVCFSAYTFFMEALMSRIASQKGDDMRFWARSVYTTEYLLTTVDWVVRGRVRVQCCSVVMVL